MSSLVRCNSGHKKRLEGFSISVHKISPSRPTILRCIENFKNLEMSKNELLESGS